MEVELEPAKEEGLDDISGARSRLNISTTKVEMGMEARWLDTEEGGEEVTTASMDRCGFGCSGDGGTELLDTADLPAR